MASFSDTQFVYSPDKGRNIITAVVSIGATGAPTLQKFEPGTSGSGEYVDAPSGGWKKVASVARTGTGAYTLTLDKSYVRLAGASFAFAASGGLAAAPIVGLVQSGSTLLTGGKVLKVQCCSAQGTAADPAEDEFMFVTLDVLDSAAV